MHLTYQHTAEAVGTQDSASDRDEISDGEIVVSLNPYRGDAPVYWRWLDADDADNRADGQINWRHIPFCTADLPLDDAGKVAFVRFQADVDEQT